MEMYVKRRTFRSRWQRTIERQNGLALRVAHPAHPQDFSSVAELQPQKVIHDCPPLTHQLRKNFLRSYHLHIELGANRPAEGESGRVRWLVLDDGASIH
jgi:hypothetical protein